MVDTVRTMSELLTIFADGQDGGITAQDVRDLIVSTLGQTGFADYQDGTHTTGSPQLLTASTNNQIEIDGAISRLQEIPFGVTQFWDSASNTIDIPVAGSGFMVTFETTVRRASGTGDWELKSYIDIGLPGPVELYPRTQQAAKVSGDKKLTWTTGAYGLDTWVLNGGKIMLNPEVDAECFGSRVVIHQTHRGRGTYP